MLEVPENSVLAGKKLAVKLEISGGGAGGFDRVMLSHTLHPTPSPTFASSDKPTLSPTESKISLRPTKVPSVRLINRHTVRTTDRDEDNVTNREIGSRCSSTRALDCRNAEIAAASVCVAAISALVIISRSRRNAFSELNVEMKKSPLEPH